METSRTRQTGSNLKQLMHLVSDEHIYKKDIEVTGSLDNRPSD